MSKIIKQKLVIIYVISTKTITWHQIAFGASIEVLIGSTIGNQISLQEKRANLKEFSLDLFAIPSGLHNFRRIGFQWIIHGGECFLLGGFPLCRWKFYHICFRTLEISKTSLNCLSDMAKTCLIEFVFNLF